MLERGIEYISYFVSERGIQYNICNYVFERRVQYCIHNYAVKRGSQLETWQNAYEYVSMCLNRDNMAHINVFGWKVHNICQYVLDRELKTIFRSICFVRHTVRYIGCFF